MASSARGLKYRAVSILILDSEISKVRCRSLSGLEKSLQVKIVEQDPVITAVDRCSHVFFVEEPEQFTSWDLEI